MEDKSKSMTISCILMTHLLVMPENVAELPGSVGCWSTNNFNLSSAFSKPYRKAGMKGKNRKTSVSWSLQLFGKPVRARQYSWGTGLVVRESFKMIKPTWELRIWTFMANVHLSKKICYFCMFHLADSFLLFILSKFLFHKVISKPRVFWLWRLMLEVLRAHLMMDISHYSIFHWWQLAIKLCNNPEILNALTHWLQITHSKLCESNQVFISKGWD